MNAIVKHWINKNSNTIFLCVLSLLILLNVAATVSENELFLRLTKPLFVPVLLTYFFRRHKYLNVIIAFFLLFSFAGDIASVFPENLILVKVSSLAYCLSYICLISVAVMRVKTLNFDKIIGVYLVVVFAINAFLLFKLFNVLKHYIPESAEITLFGIKSVSLIILAFVSFVVYLNNDSKKSILFLMMALCFVFSDVLFYISNYYLYNWSFVMIDRVLHGIGLFFLIQYIIEVNRSRKKKLVKQRRMSSKEIIA